MAGRLKFGAIVAVGGLLACGGAIAQPTNDGAVIEAPKAVDWDTLAKLPDWSGAWVPDVEDQFTQMRTNPPPWTPAVAKEMALAAGEERAGNPRGLFIDCLPEAMPSWMLISHNAMEVLFTPGRVTMLGEADGNRLRRVFTDGRQHPADVDPSFFGHSIGHWEGDTLVVDTVGILPETYLAVSEAVGVPNDGDMHIVERIHLVGANTLADELEITAPRVLTKTWKTTRLFRRDRLRRDQIVEGVCLQGAFTEGKDKAGHAAFIPVPLDNGNLVPQNK